MKREFNKQPKKKKRCAQISLRLQVLPEEKPSEQLKHNEEKIPKFTFGNNVKRNIYI